MIEILLGGVLVAMILLVMSLVASITVTGLIILTMPKFERKSIALGSAGMFPIMSILAVFTGFLNGIASGFSGNELVSTPMFGLGAALALLLAWPIAYFLTKRLFRLDKSKTIK